MDPLSGEIVAMAVSPSLDLNRFNEQTNAGLFKNPQNESVYEMGSIIKPLTMAAGLDSGTITEASVYDDTGCITLEQKKICNFDAKARGVIPMQEILSQSLNVGSAYIATKMGPVTFREYFLNRYKLGVETGIDLPGEIRGGANLRVRKSAPPPRSGRVSLIRRLKRCGRSALGNEDSWLLRSARRQIRLFGITRTRLGFAAADIEA